MALVVGSAVTHVNIDGYDLREDQLYVLQSPNTDAYTMLLKIIKLSEINPVVGALGIFSSGLTAVFVLAVAKALKEVIPAFPS